MPKNAQGGYDKEHQPNWGDPAEVEHYKSWLGQQQSNPGSKYAGMASNPVHAFGLKYNLDMDSNRSNMLQDYYSGMQLGKEQFVDDPEMQRLKKLREDYAKGYSGEELGGMRETARAEIAGSQAAQARKLASGAARGGVGGARAAAMQAANAREGGKAVADAERKMALDSAQMKRQGAGDLQDFIFRQKMGQMGTGAGFMTIGSSQRAADKGIASNTGGGKK